MMMMMMMIGLLCWQQKQHCSSSSSAALAKQPVHQRWQQQLPFHCQGMVSFVVMMTSCQHCTLLAQQQQRAVQQQQQQGTLVSAPRLGKLQTHVIPVTAPAVQLLQQQVLVMLLLPWLLIPHRTLLALLLQQLAMNSRLHLGCCGCHWAANLHHLALPQQQQQQQGMKMKTGRLLTCWSLARLRGSVWLTWLLLIVRVTLMRRWWWT
jgi:hypothetical protein